MATTEIQREQIILAARKDATRKTSDIAREYEVTAEIASSLISKAKRRLGDEFYLNGQKPPTANYMLVLGCLERSPNVAVTVSSIMNTTGLTFEQVKSGVKILNANHCKHIERSGEKMQTHFIYKPNHSIPRELVRKLTMKDVFNIMNQVE
ncbi:hypothetical protein C1N32_20760 [Vibrio diazotrophicus]|uniref:Uncharacterized protein n=1 Tax=Vibrio diazotrophicus TaxID=685 RepID=A0A2J8HSD0_VIBDI|nr:hypothetical protein [Vibrio diazotrophicus]PNI01197.1 hypothetical protein C1N32_20760 [Vibrio diazotrophicus]